MALNPGALLGAVVGPGLASVTGRAQRFPPTSPTTRAALDRVPQVVVCGFRWAMEARSVAELERYLLLIEPELRGFGYEGATMAYTMLDAPSRGQRTRELLQGPGLTHLFLSYIGIGFAMSRLPRALWPRVLPDLDAPPYHPALSWLAVDGYAFDKAYFGHRRRAATRELPPWPWHDHPSYFPRACDQGYGRALWFIHGADPARVGQAVQSVPLHRQADLWAGAALAATYAGPYDSSGAALLAVAPEEFRAELACGAMLASAARLREGVVPNHAEQAVRALTTLSASEAAALADSCAVSGSGGADYEQWRANIRARWSDSVGASRPPATGVRR